MQRYSQKDTTFSALSVQFKFLFHKKKVISKSVRIKELEELEFI